jgi:membrane protease YdiL (CAAX protease family)
MAHAVMTRMMLATCSVAAPRPRLLSGAAAASIAVSVFVFAAWISQLLPPDSVHWIKWFFVAPVVEELFFRGVVHAGLRARGGLCGRPWTAIVVTACCFGLAHLGFATAAHSALVVAPGLAIGWVYERTRSIPLCIGLHSAFNAIWFGFWSL